MLWRRSYDTPPPPIADDDEWSQAGDPQYADLADEICPRTECLKDVVERMLPYWYDAIVPDLRAGQTVCVAAHGNSLRALVKHLDDMSEEAIVGLNIPTGIPLVYRLDEDLRPAQRGGEYLDPEAAADAASGGQPGPRLRQGHFEIGATAPTRAAGTPTRPSSPEIRGRLPGASRFQSTYSTPAGPRAVLACGTGGDGAALGGSDGDRLGGGADGLRGHIGVERARGRALLDGVGRGDVQRRCSSAPRPRWCIRCRNTCSTSSAVGATAGRSWSPAPASARGRGSGWSSRALAARPERPPPAPNAKFQHGPRGLGLQHLVEVLGRRRTTRSTGAASMRRLVVLLGVDPRSRRSWAQA